MDAAELGGGGGESPGDECRLGLSPLLVDVPCEGLAEEEDNTCRIFVCLRFLQGPTMDKSRYFSKGSRGNPFPHTEIGNNIWSVMQSGITKKSVRTFPTFSIISIIAEPRPLWRLGGYCHKSKKFKEFFFLNQKGSFYGINTGTCQILKFN